MGFLTGGPYYHLVGRTGNNVGRVKNGKNTFAMRPHKSNKPATQLQLDQRLQFGLFTSWVAELGLFVDIGFKDYDADMSPRNACMSYNFKQNVITGVSPNYSIDFGKVVLSRGKLVGVELPDVATGAGISVEFSWSADPGFSNAKATDKMYFAVYDPTADRFALVMGAVTRAALGYTMLLPAEFSGHMVRAWVMVVSADGKLVSNSVHLGPVPVG